MDGAFDSNALEQMMALGFKDRGYSVDTVLATYEDAVEYYQDFYRTDHHWNGYDAIKAYNEIPESYGLRKVEDAKPLEGIKDIRMKGSNARVGLDMLNGPACEPALELSDLSVIDGYAPLILEEDGVTKLHEESYRAESNFYEAWYGSWVNTVLENSASAVNENALILCDSFGTAFRYLVACNFNKTYVDYDMHTGKENLTETLSEIIEASECEVVFFVARPGNYISFIDRYPDYFKQG